jgi:membrane-bound hydrogenase subunit beta
MSKEEIIKNDIIKRFPKLAEAIVIKRERRMWLDVDCGQVAEVFDHLVKKMKFKILSAITGLDEGTSLAVIYHMSPDNCVMLSLRTHLSKENPVIATVSHLFPNADIYEREMVDLLGIKVTGLSETPRYPLPETWPRTDFPLRKEFKVAVKPPEGGK